MSTALTSEPPPRLLDWLVGAHIDHELREHAPAFSALETAREEGVDPTTFAKVVAITADGGRRALIVLDAVDRLDLRKARRVMSGGVRLLTETELAELAPDCEVGALPAIGALYGLPTYADICIRDVRRISFKAGTHAHDIRLDRRTWEREVGVTYVDLAHGPSAGTGAAVRPFRRGLTEPARAADYERRR